MTRGDRTGVALVTATAGWVLVSAAANDGSRPVPTLAALAGVSVAFVAGRRGRRWLDVDPGGRATAAVAALAGALVGLLARFEPFEPGGAPLGYGNANAAVLGVVAFAGAAVAVVTRRPAAWAVAGLAGLTALVAGSAFGAVSFGAGFVLVALGGAVRSSRPAAALAALLLVAAVAGTAAAGSLAEAEESSTSIGVRVQLWREALDLAGDEPLLGIGPGRFEDHQRVSDDRDLRRAHAEPLQAAAELGLPGAALVLLIPLWALAVLARTRSGAAVFAVGAVAAVTLHSTVDWVTADPAVALSLAALVGAASRR